MDSEKSFKDQLLLDAENLITGGAVGTAISTAATVANRAMNHFAPQEYPIGELFADYVLDTNNFRKGPHFATYTQSFPRVMSDLQGGGLKTDLLSPMLANHDKLDFAASDIDELRQIFLDEGNKALKVELLGGTPPDKLSKVPGLLESIKNGGDPVKINDSLQTLLHKEYGIPDNIKSPAAMVTAPRNSMPIMAHEFGHLFETMERSDSINKGPEVWRKFKEAWNSVHENVGVKRLDQSSLLPDSWRSGIAKFKDNLKKTPGGLVWNTALESFISNPLVIAATPITSSKTVRDAIGDLDSSGNLQKVMDWIGDHNVAVAALAAAPSFVHEAATTAPGYKAIVDFWKEFNKGEAGALAGSELLKKSAPLIGKKKPWLEGLKFLGSNALTLLPPLAPIIGAAVGNLITKDSEDK